MFTCGPALMTSGGDPFFSSTSLLVHADASLVDSSSYARTLTAVGGAAASATQSKFGGGSLRLDGVGDKVTAANSSDFAMGSGNFTLELWWRPDSGSADSSLIELRTAVISTNNDYGFLLRHLGSITGFLQFAAYNGTSQDLNLASASGLSSATWYHIAAVRSGNTAYLFINGTLSSSVAWSTPVNFPASSLLYLGGNSFDAAGYMDDIRITKGVARYTANFTPPTAALPDS